MSARAALRDRTSAEHERVDRLFSTLDLSRDEHYRRFLLAQAAAFLPVEEALGAGGIAELIGDWQARRRGALLVADLLALGRDPPPAIASPALGSAPAMLGALYVLEGSRLGGAVLKRSLSPHAPRAFLTAPQPPGSWRKLLENMEQYLYRTELVEAAIGAARGVFQNFEAAGRLYLESGRL